ncbi:MAG: Gldg family protein [Clostridia bacterium]|nr:Gldg family protein [Clostridia bacterium]
MHNENNTNITPAEKKPKAGLNKKYLKIGSFSITMTAVVIAIVIAANLFIAEIPTTYTKYDLSSASLYSIGAETETILADVDEDVTFTLLAQRGSEDETIVELIGRYAALNSRIKMKTVDPITNPTFIDNYTAEGVSPNSVIVESGKRHYVVDYYDIYTVEYSEEEIYNYYYYGQMPAGTPYFSGELALTTALDYVTRDDLPTAYTLTGHGETALSQAIESYISAENIARVSDYSMLTAEKLPDDCSSIIINQPTSDISPDECEKLITYLNEGGNIILTTGAIGFNSNLMPNLAALAKFMGLESVDGLVLETDQNRYMMAPHYLLPTLGTTSSGPLALLPNSQIYVLANASHGILSDGTRTVTPLLTTTKNAYVKGDLSSEDLSKTDDDIEGMVYIGAAVEIEANGTRADSGKFVWFSSPGLADESADMYVSGGNSAVFMAAVNWMSENKTSLSILAKQMQVEALTVPAADAAVWSVIVIFVIPLAVFAAGFVIWFRRRKR